MLADLRSAMTTTQRLGRRVRLVDGLLRGLLNLVDGVLVLARVFWFTMSPALSMAVSTLSAFLDSKCLALSSRPISYTHP